MCPIGLPDLALFHPLAAPSLLLAFELVQGVSLVTGYRPAGRAAPLLAGQFLGLRVMVLSLYGLLKLRYDRAVLVVARLGDAAKGLWVSVVADRRWRCWWYSRSALKTPEIQMPIKNLLSDRSSIVLVGLFAVTLGPLCEELAFRGFLLPLVARSLGPVAGVLISALPFAILHGPQYSWSWRHVVLITLAGSAFGWMRLHSRSTLTATLMHAG